MRVYYGGEKGQLSRCEVSGQYSSEAQSMTVICTEIASITNWRSRLSENYVNALRKIVEKLEEWGPLDINRKRPGGDFENLSPDEI